MVRLESIKLMCMNTDTENYLRNKILKTTPENFNETALDVFHFQYLHNETYRRYCDLLKRAPHTVTTIENIPYLPIKFFKTKKIKTTSFEEEIIFESSGTTGSVNSRHYVKEKRLYEESFLNSFRYSYGHENKYCILGLLPSYLERGNSSLVFMVQKLISGSDNENSGFYLDEYEKLKDVLLQNEALQKPTLLIGVTYALVDFAEKNNLSLKHTIVMETGGMKGRRTELSRTLVHKKLISGLGVSQIHSEYGMTELLSQSYSSGNGIFKCSSSMKILLRSEDDPFEITSQILPGEKLKSGAVNIIDLANLYSCSFIATDDGGKLYPGGEFEITGRIENSDMRGCSLLAL